MSGQEKRRIRSVTDPVERILADAREKIDKHGVAIIATNDPVFAYTVGLTRLRHPELIVTGLPPTTAHGILDNAAQLVLAGRYLIAGDRLGGILTNPAYQVVIAGPVSTAGNEAYKPVIARRIYAQVAWSLQVVYPDADDRFPWDPGYNMTMQPLLAPAPGDSDAGRRQRP